MSASRIGYHFLQANMRAGAGREKPWTVGETRTLKSTKAIVPCRRGFHASPTAWDALKYAPGPVLCLVEVSGDMREHGGDKFVGRTRRPAGGAMEATEAA